MEHEAKLKRFQTAVFTEIEAKAERETAESKDEFEQKLKESTDKQLQLSYEDIQNKTADIKKQTKRELSKIGLDNKRILIGKRNDLLQSIFKNVESKILDFVKTQDYQDLLLDEVEAFSNKYELSDVEIHVGCADFNKAMYIEKAYKLPCTTILDTNILLGGFAVKDSKGSLYYDYTLGNKLLEYRVEFLSNNEFAL